MFAALFDKFRSMGWCWRSKWPPAFLAQ